MSATRVWRRLLLGVALTGGVLFSGPCGITTLQMQDFITSAVIRTSVTTLASVLESATIDAAADEQTATEETDEEG